MKENNTLSYINVKSLNTSLSSIRISNNREILKTCVITAGGYYTLDDLYLKCLGVSEFETVKGQMASIFTKGLYIYPNCDNSNTVYISEDINSNDKYLLKYMSIDQVTNKLLADDMSGFGDISVMKNPSILLLIILIVLF